MLHDLQKAHHRQPEKVRTKWRATGPHADLLVAAQARWPDLGTPALVDTAIEQECQPDMRKTRQPLQHGGIIVGLEQQDLAQGTGRQTGLARYSEPLFERRAYDRDRFQHDLLPFHVVHICVLLRNPKKRHPPRSATGRFGQPAGNYFRRNLKLSAIRTIAEEIGGYTMTQAQAPMPCSDHPACPSQG